MTEHAEILDLQNDVLAEANEYVVYFQEQGMVDGPLASAIRVASDDARLAGRPDLSTALQQIADSFQHGRLTRRMVTSRGDVIDTDLTNDEAIAILRTMKWSEFAVSLIVQYDQPRKGRKTPAQMLSDRQWAWVHKLALEQQAREQKRAADKAAAAARGPIRYAQIRALFEHALATGHKTPRITLDMDEGRVRLSVAGQGSRTPGAVHVTDGGPFGENRYYGRIDLDGSFKPGRDVPAWVLDTLFKLDGRTLEFVVKYGQKTGNCCFCGAGLVTTESVTVGYGPICADRYGLPWGF